MRVCVHRDGGQSNLKNSRVGKEKRNTKRKEIQIKIADSRNEVAANSLESDIRLNQKKRTAVKKK